MERLIVFAKAPRLHEVKTRLGPALTAGQALGIHEAMLLDQLAFAASFRGEGRSCELCLDRPFEPGPALAATMETIDRAAQGEGDLGARLSRALERALSSGASRAAIVGADAPTLPMSLVEDAFASLRSGADAAIVPADDGGYVLVGASRPVPLLFDGIPWGTPGVLEATRRSAATSRYRLEETAAWFDVDVADDLVRLARELPASPGRAPATAAFLAGLGLYSPGNPVL